MTAKDRERHERNRKLQDPALPSESRAPAVSAPRDVWLGRGLPAGKAGVIWLKRPMPDGQWPPDRRAPRDDSFSWWVRSACGHQGGVRHWAFYDEAVADQYGHLFRANPCWYTPRCPERIMIQNNPGRLR